MVKNSSWVSIVVYSLCISRKINFLELLHFLEKIVIHLFLIANLFLLFLFINLIHRVSLISVSLYQVLNERILLALHHRRVLVGRGCSLGDRKLKGSKVTPGSPPLGVDYKFLLKGNSTVCFVCKYFQFVPIVLLH